MLARPRPPARRARARATLASLALAVVAASLGGAAAWGGTARCRAPSLAGASLATARTRVASAGCALILRGLEQQGLDGRQLVARQSPPPGTRANTVTLWLAPLCRQMAAAGPPRGEPFVTRGPTGLRAGLYLAGGPLVLLPRCRVGTPVAGQIDVLGAGGAVVARASVAAGRLASFRLAPGSYGVEGTFANASENGVPMHAGPVRVTVAAGRSVRQDVVLGLP